MQNLIKKGAASMEDTETKMKSLGKSLSLLNCFIEKQPLGITDICKITGLNKSNVHDILSTFVDMKYLIKDPDTRKYSLGINALRLGRAAGKNITLWDVASVRIREVANIVNETVFFAIPFERYAFYADIAMPGEVRTPSITRLYDVDELHSVACGKAILAFMPESFIEEYLSVPLTRYTEYTVCDPDQLRLELLQTRRKGYARAFMDRTLGICSVAVPIFGGKGEVLGSISISGSSFTVTEDKVQDYALLLRANAESISASMY